MRVQAYLGERDRGLMTRLLLAFGLLAPVLLLSLPGCQSPLGESCRSDDDCAADPDPCARRHCAHESEDSDDGICVSVPEPSCGDTGPDAPLMDVPVLDTSGADVPGLDAPARDTPGADTPDARGSAVTGCPPPPVDVVDRELGPLGAYDPIAVLCGIRGPGCFITTTVVGSIPPDPTECPGENGGLNHGTSAAGVPVLSVFGSWALVAADVPVEPLTGRVQLRTGASSEVVVEHTDGERYSVLLDARPGAALWRSVAPYVGPAPHFGEAYACLGDSHDYIASVPSPAGDVFVRVCDERTALAICTVHGDTGGSSEAESCSAYALDLGYTVGPPRAPYARAPVGTSYRITTASHGTIGGSGRSLAGPPLDTDVTLTAGDGSNTLEIVARWTATGVTASVLAQ